MSNLSFRFTAGKFHLNEWDLIQCHGADRRRFLDGQTTADLKKWTDDFGVLTARLNRSGRVQSYFYVLTLDQVDYILAPKLLTQKILTDLERFIIMDDVSFEVLEQKAWLLFGVQQEEKIKSTKIQFYGDLVAITISSLSELNIPSVLPEDLELLRLVNGWPCWESEAIENKLLNETRLNELAVDYQKGCFLGQETVAKIQNNRGAAYYPALIEITQEGSLIHQGELYSGTEKIASVIQSFEFASKKYLAVHLSRKFRVQSLEISFKYDVNEFVGKVHYYPLLKGENLEMKALELFELASIAFQDGDEEQAVNLLKLAIKANPKMADAYESLGVILGRQEKYEAAIDLMSQLEEVDPLSVMAHTNKSLYLMKLGNIEQAEEEKAKATLKSFEMYGREADTKKMKEQQQLKQAQERKQREAMFNQVLEIDDKDEIANFGLADIFYSENKIDEAIEKLKFLIEVHPKYTQAYLLMGKCLEIKKDKGAAEVYKKGIEIASSRGELMPANEMQSRLSALAQ
jgi:folate-binding protein YgfZ